MASSITRFAILAISLVALAACGPASVVDQSRLIEVHGDRAFICLSNAVNDSMPPTCGAKAGTSENPELHGPMVSELIEAMDGTNQWVTLSAGEEGGNWVLNSFELQR